MVGRRLIAALGLAASALACGDDGVGPQLVSSIAVTSPIGDRLAVGRTVQLNAEVRDARGAVLPGVAVTWSSSAPNIAPITAMGVVSGVGAGTATVSARADGVTDTLSLRVVGADLHGIALDLNDAFTSALVAGLTLTVRGRIQSLLDTCGDGVVQGDFTMIEGCLIAGRAEVSAATDPTDRVLLATVALFLDHIERLLRL